VLSAELELFDEDLVRRPFLVVASKVDAGRERLEEFLDRFPDALPISAVTGEGIPELTRRLGASVAETRESAPARVGYVRTIVRPETIDVEKEDGAWRVKGSRPERAVAVTDLDNEEAVLRMQRRLIAMGVERLLESAGAVEGDEVRIGEAAFDFEPEHRKAATDES
jgi:GTP-binding protein